MDNENVSAFEMLKGCGAIFYRIKEIFRCKKEDAINE